MQYSNHLGSIGDEQFDAALQRLGLGNFVKAEKITCGIIGQNVFLTSTTGEYVFRGNPFYEEQLPLEKFVVESLREHTATPVAYPYLVDNSTDIFGWPYAIMPRLQGIQIANGGTIIVELTKVDRVKIARAMAAALAEMHKLTFEDVKNRPEINIMTGMVWQGTEHVDFIKKQINETIAGLPNVSVITPDDVAYVNTITDQGMDALSVPFDAVFFMGDFKEDNVVFSNVNGEWRVCGVFDFAMSHFSDGDMDLARLYAMYVDEDMELAKAFISEYIRLNPPREGFYERFKLYSLHERLGIWWWAKNEKLTLWDADISLKEWLEKYIRGVGELE